jgi:high-affinity Fe2+/Pb2+ permease
MTGSFSYLGFFAGMIIAVFIGYAIVIQGRKINLKAFFSRNNFYVGTFCIRNGCIWNARN